MSTHFPIFVLAAMIGLRLLAVAFGMPQVLPLSAIALAAASTIAGNLLILGAASNVIVIESAERHGETLTFMEFARAGIPLTIANAIVYAIFFALFAG